MHLHSNEIYSWLSSKICTLFSLAFLFILIASFSVQAQQGQFYLEVQLHPYYGNAESIRLIDVISSQEGGGPPLFSLFLQNENNQQREENLYFSIRIHSDRNGIISDEQQISGFPFGLNPGQQLVTDYYNVKHELPELPENIYFDGGLTAAGEQMFNNLGGSSLLPPDRYVVEVEVYQGGNRNSGGKLVATSSTELGVNLTADAHVLYLIGPGGEPGSDIQISTLYPEFQWDGTAGSTYRLVVVEASRDESPESLIGGALSTEAIRQGSGIRSGQGNLAHEILDFRVNTSTFQFPSSGVQPLEPGKRYYWQVLSERTGSNGTVTHPSEIWSFSVTSMNQLVQAEGELVRILKGLLGEARYQQLSRSGYNLESIEIDGTRHSGAMVMELLRQIRNDLSNGSTTSIVKE